MEWVYFLCGIGVGFVMTAVAVLLAIFWPKFLGPPPWSVWAGPKVFCAWLATGRDVRADR